MKNDNEIIKRIEIVINTIKRYRLGSIIYGPYRITPVDSSSAIVINEHEHILQIFHPEELRAWLISINAPPPLIELAYCPTGETLYSDIHYK